MGSLNFSFYIFIFHITTSYFHVKQKSVSTKCPRFYPVPFFLFHSRVFHVKIKLLRKNRLVVDRHLFLQSRQFRLYKRFYFVQRTEADAKSWGRKFDREASLSFSLSPSRFSRLRLASRVPLLLLTWLLI